MQQGVLPTQVLADKLSHASVPTAELCEGQILVFLSVLRVKYGNPSPSGY